MYGQQQPQQSPQQQLHQPPQQPFPIRTSPSHHLSANLTYEPWQQQQQQTSPDPDQLRRGSYQPAPPNLPYVQEAKKQSLRSRIAAG